jgi:hypothetical protein
LYLGHADGTTIYVCNSALSAFVNTVLPWIEYKFVLVSGDADGSVPYDVLSEPEFQTLVSSPLLLHWYCQNLLVSHVRASAIPIGLDYHTLRAHMGMMHPWGPGITPKEQESALFSIRDSARPLRERKMLCYSNFHHGNWGINTRGDRQELLASMNHELIAFSSRFCDRLTSWREMATCAFVLSPRGGGYDCHRTWEALALGCIPIVRSSPLDPLFEDLPVLIVPSWNSITEDILKEALVRFGSRDDVKKLHLAYWLEKIETSKQKS